MKTKLLLMMGMVLFFVERGVGQCPVVSYSKDDVTQEYLLNGGSSFHKGIKILMEDTLMPYRFQIEYFSKEGQKLMKEKFMSHKYKVDLPGYKWNSHVYDSIDSFHAVLLDLRHSWIPLDLETLTKSEFINLKVSTFLYSRQWDWGLADTLCDLTLKSRDLLPINNIQTNEYIIYSNNNGMIFESKNSDFIVDKVLVTDFGGKATSIDFLKSSLNAYFLDTESLTSGVYILQIFSKDGKMVSKKFLVN
jgi:hypothetical protein